MNNFYSSWRIAGNQFLKMLLHEAQAIVSELYFYRLFSEIVCIASGDRWIFSASYEVFRLTHCKESENPPWKNSFTRRLQDLPIPKGEGEHFEYQNFSKGAVKTVCGVHEVLVAVPN